VKNIRNQAPLLSTHYDARTDTYNNKGIGFSLSRLSARAEFLICLALLIATYATIFI